jgi:hypothetical protein
MESKGKAFTKGGLGCLGAFFIVAVFTLLIGGRVHIDPCGAVMLFVIGGLLGMLVLWIYNKGKEDAHQDWDKDI